MSIRIIFVYLHIETTGIPHSAELHKSLKTNSLPLQSNSRQRPDRGYTDSFDATGLRAGMYIVRVNYRNVNGKSQVVYLKLIKE